MVFPEYDLCIKLCDGDVMTFDSSIYHAGVAYPESTLPTGHRCIVHVVGFYFKSQQRAYYQNHADKCNLLGLSYTVDSESDSDDDECYPHAKYYLSTSASSICMV